ncbi:TonB-dependent receptor [Massilia sp. DWR3-1-1]|uniref:TonB-dependent receptor n=1 Tax=Massilia sp. DWR3-1-1 TaxID=2804559 RepID=UPI003CFA5114
MNHHTPHYVAVAALLAASAALPAHAQTLAADPAPPMPLATVIVTGQLPVDGQRPSALATGSAASPMAVPFSVNSVAAERIRDQAGTSLQDALRNIPGAQADTGFNGAHTQFFILRGAVTDSGTGSSRVMRDGVRLSNYPYVPAFIESVDVLRGPGAAVGVRSEPGGTVNLVTRQPRLHNAGSVLLSAGQHGARELSVDLNRVLSADDELAARIIATRSEASQWRHVPDRLDGVKLGLAKSGGSDYHLVAGFEAINQTYRPDYGIPAIDGGPVAVPRDRQFGEPFGDSTTNNRIVDLHADVGLGGAARLAIDASHLEAHSTSIKNLLNGSPLPGQPAGTYARVSAWEPDTRRRIDSLATSLTSQQQFAGIAHTLFFGVDYYRETLNQPGLSVPASTSPSINVYHPVYGRVTAPASGLTLARSLTTEALKAVSGSAQDQVDLGAWSAVLGLRYTDQQFVYGAANVLPVNEARWSPKLGLLYRLSPRDTVYANLASGVSPNQVASSSNQSLPSRQSRQAELGWKSLWLDGALMGDLALYRLKQSNMISADQSTPLNNFDFTVDGTARSQGLEASLTGAVGAQLNVSVAYAYTDARYLQNAVYGGKRVPNVARQALTLWGQYRWNGGWKSGAGWYLQGARFADEANSTTLPGYGRVDLTHTWQHKISPGQSLEVQIAVRNAFDQQYYVSSHLHVSRWITPAQGRNLSVTGSYRF